MATNFPTGLDTTGTFPAGTATQPLSNPDHPTSHSNIQAALVAIETYLGIVGSAVVSSVTYLLTNVASIDPGHKHTFAGSITGTVPVTRGGTGQTSIAKGGLFQGNGANTAGVLAIGTDAQILVADSTQATGAKWVTPAPGTSPFVSFSAAIFGGSGSDGALAITAGTTTVNCGGAAVVVKNYSSISITGSGVLAFSNPHPNGTTIFLLSQGAVTLSSSATPMIDISLMGAAGGAASVASTVTTTNGNPGNTASGAFVSITAGRGADGTSAAGGTPSYAINNAFFAASLQLMRKYPWIAPGSGGGSGSAKNASGVGNTATSGAGSAGAGALVIECGGVFTFGTTGGLSTTPAAAGSASTSGSSVSANGGSCGGGGTIYITYNFAGVITGTVSNSVGTPGNGSTIATNQNVSSGAGGGSSKNAGTNSTSNSAAATGVVGGAGFSLIEPNQTY